MVTARSESPLRLQKRRPDGPVLVGTLRRVYDLDGTLDPVCVLVTDQGEAFHLSSLGASNDEHVDVAAALGRFEAQLVGVRFERREDTVFGPSLWGVSVETLD